MKYNDLRSFFADLGTGNLNFLDIKKVIFPDDFDQQIVSVDDSEKQMIDKPGFNLDFHGQVTISMEDVKNVMVRFAKCCDPKPGDPILGYTTRGRGITIHREDCNNPGFRNLINKEPERISKVSWVFKNKGNEDEKTLGKLK